MIDLLTIPARIDTARMTPRIVERARAIYADLVPAFFRDRVKAEEGVTVSDAGRCGLELYADLQGLLDIPRAARSYHDNMDPGTAMGGWFGALLKASLEETDPEIRCELEVDTETQGIKGHADTVLSDSDEAVVVDYKRPMKWSHIAPDHVDSKDSTKNGSFQYILQTGIYAKDPRIAAKRIAIVQQLPNCRAQAWGVDVYNVADFEDHIRHEIMRLRMIGAAQSAPEPDPRAKWNCEYCRFSACAKNKNPQRVLATEMVWEAS